MGVDYVERQAGPEEADRGRVLEALAGGSFWAFLIAEVDSSGSISLKLEMDDRMDVDDLKAVLQKTLAGLP